MGSKIHFVSKYLLLYQIAYDTDLSDYWVLGGGGRGRGTKHDISYLVYVYVSLLSMMEGDYLDRTACPLTHCNTHLLKMVKSGTLDCQRT